MELLVAVQRRCGTASVPPPEIIAAWKTQFLGVRARSFRDNRGETDPRGQEIAAVFDELQQLSQQVHE